MVLWMLLVPLQDPSLHLVVPAFPVACACILGWRVPASRGLAVGNCCPAAKRDWLGGVLPGGTDCGAVQAEANIQLRPHFPKSFSCYLASFIPLILRASSLLITCAWIAVSGPPLGNLTQDSKDAIWSLWADINLSNVKIDDLHQRPITIAWKSH